ncbi:MAG: ABC transporter substrate-binding protein [Eubacterium sp.]|nr:ABC transporter substrate-binding protein [Eubacterium sp.]MCM1217131.1 ABC transporter substrate-binding protein [Lachnospiraceae bacterium]MCM1240347.1 ABC transporter substrate-binding protein [Lachnospiraceae bacterium]
MKKTKRNPLKKAAALGLSLLMLAGVLGGCGEADQSAISGRVQAVTVRIGSLKGPTSLGLLNLMDKSSKGETTDDYEFQMAVGADELLPLMVKGDLDIALVPANVAAVLYQKTDGGVAVIDINTLGVLYLVTGTAEISGIADLKGKTVYLTGKGTTPEASLRYLLDVNGLAEEDVTLEFKSEATEVAAVLAEDPDAIGLLPQPFVTAACMQNEDLNTVLDINEEWIRAQGGAGNGNGMVTGVTVIRREFLEAYPEAVAAFLEEHAASTRAVNDDPDTGAALAVQQGIVAKEPIAQKAIPQCNIVCVTGQEMKEALSAYLDVLYDFNAELTGGAIPGDNFYYIP